jgi:hypothetical protein
MKKPLQKTFIVTDAIMLAHDGYMTGDTQKAHDYASLALWRADRIGYYLSDLEQHFLFMVTTPKRSKRRKV